MNLTMLQRLVKGDPDFAGRVEAASWVAGVEYTQALLRAVAADEAIQSAAELDEHLTIDSSGVSDDAIVAAVHAFKTESTE